MMWVDDRPWIDVGQGHRIWLAPDGMVAAWEHPRGAVKPDAFYASDMPSAHQHEVAPVTPTTWSVVCADPLTLSPSLYCDPARGGCGAHGFVQDGRWS